MTQEKIKEAVSFYDKMPEPNRPLIIVHNDTNETYEAVRKDVGLWVGNKRVSGCYYSWVYSSHHPKASDKIDTWK